MLQRTLFGLLFVLSLPAQDYRGKLQGIVTDPAGAALPGAMVTLRNTDTGVNTTRHTGGDGRYVFDFVESGQYTVSVEAASFKRFEQRGITVQNRGDITVDARLALGAVSESITVEESPVAVQFNSSSDTLTVGRELVDQMPIRGRNPYNITTLDPTLNGGEAAENRPYHHAFANELDAGGQTTRANDVQLDGVPLTSSYKTSYTPSIEAVGEVSFQKNAVDSEFGYSAGGVVILNMRSGTNKIKGSGYYHNRNPRFNAIGDPTLPRVAGADETANRGTNLKMFGGTLGGPIIRNKLFFFSSYEQWDDKRPISVKITLPTAAERQGNFAQSVRTCRVGNAPVNCVRAIYDPLTSTGASGIRTPYPGNVLPVSAFDATSVKLLRELPMPNLASNDLNWQGAKSELVDYWNMSHRADWNINARLKTFVRYGQFKTSLLEQPPADATGNLFPYTGSNRNGLSIAADTVYTISTKQVLNIRANFHRLTDEAATPAILGQQGLENLWPGNPWYQSLYTREDIYYPAVDVGTSNRLGRTGREFWQRPQGWGASARMNQYMGAHQMKFGAELRVDRGKGARFEPINLNFRQVLTADRQGGSDLNNSGSEWATFLLGYLDNNSNVRRIPVQEVVTMGYSSYFQDDFKLHPRLTLNLGLRWEFEPGPVDRQNRLSQRLDLTSPIPEFQSTPPVMPDAARALMASKGYNYRWNGAWIFTSPDSRRAWSRKALNLLPRIGGAWRVNDRSALRFGYARYMSPSSRIRDPLGDFVNQYTGYSTLTTVNAPLNGLPLARVSDPFPSSGPNRNPVQLPVEKALGRYTNLGNPVSLDQYELRPQMNDRFTLSYQREVWERTVVSFDFFYNHGINVPYNVDLNLADPNFFYDNPRTVTSAQVRNPFLNILTAEKFPGALRNTPTNTTVGALLRPYPQYGAITQTNTAGKTIHTASYKLQAQRPFYKGLSMIAAYAYQRESRTEFFDDRAEFARDFSWRFLPAARHRFNYALTYQLPFGKRRALLNNVPAAVDSVIGGWQLTSTTRWYSGRLLQFNQSLTVNGTPWMEDRTLARWFNTGAFARLPDADRNVPRTSPYNFAGVVGPRTSQTDCTVSKSFPLGERLRLEARAEAYNVLNHLNWDNPVVDFNNTNFGRILSKRPEYIGREVQFGVKLTF
ncbi:MAG: carboxypeptidase regulatory-like domain-containing protein [Acidobacteria bacterium]|nr:carboxypeptidase regulatory-like domain-containing protein [Acidobacteriota bacterium]